MDYSDKPVRFYLSKTMRVKVEGAGGTWYVMTVERFNNQSQLIPNKETLKFAFEDEAIAAYEHFLVTEGVAEWVTDNEGHSVMIERQNLLDPTRLDLPDVGRHEEVPSDFGSW